MTVPDAAPVRIPIPRRVFHSLTALLPFRPHPRVAPLSNDGDAQAQAPSPGPSPKELGWSSFTPPAPVPWHPHSSRTSNRTPPFNLLRLRLVGPTLGLSTSHHESKFSPPIVNVVTVVPSMTLVILSSVLYLRRAETSECHDLGDLEAPASIAPSRWTQSPKPRLSPASRHMVRPKNGRLRPRPRSTVTCTLLDAHTETREQKKGRRIKRHHHHLSTRWLLSIAARGLESRHCNACALLVLTSCRWIHFVPSKID